MSFYINATMDLKTGEIVDWVELAKRAVACKHWRWMPGMLNIARCRLIKVEPNDFATWAFLVDNESPECNLTSGLFRLKTSLVIPDLTDPATLGCLLHLVREAWKGWHVEINFRDVAVTQNEKWFIRFGHSEDFIVNLVNALVNAP